jgi:arylsulfatase A-like enzyme
VNPWIPILAALGAAFGEGGTAAAATLRAGGATAGEALTSFLAAAGLVLVLGLPLAGVAIGVSRLGAVRFLAASLRDGAGGGRDTAPGHPGVAILVIGWALAVAAAVGFVAGEAVVGTMSQRFAGLLLTVLGLTVACVALGAGAIVARPAVLLVRRASARLPPWMRFVGAASAGVLAVVAVAAGLGAFLPWTYVVLPSALLCGGLAGMIVGRWIPARRRVLAIGAVGMWVASLAVPFSLGGLSGVVKSTLHYRAPYAGLALGAAAPLFDLADAGWTRGTLLREVDTEAQPTPWEPPTPRAVALPSTVPRPQNVVLIQMDALRPDHLGFAGYPRPTSPRLDAFRDGATWWKNAYTPAPSTRFAMAALFTGLDPRRAPHRDLGGNRFRLLPEARTVAEALTPLGYVRHGLTISYVKHHNLGLGQGFEQWKTPWPVDDWRRIYGVAGEITSKAAVDWLDGHPPGGSPFFLFLHYRCTHDPYVKHAEWDFGDSDRDRYDSALAYCDRELGRVFDTLEARADYDRTAVVVFSDHGELFGEHGHTNHGNTLYEPDVRILLLSRIPGVTRGTVEQPVLLTDVAPTLLELAGTKPPPGMDGQSLLPLAVGDPPAMGDRPLFMFTDLWRGTMRYQASAVLRWPLKLIRDDQLDVLELYDVENDPEEQEDLSRRRRGDLARLLALLEGYTAHVKGGSPGK